MAQSLQPAVFGGVFFTYETASTIVKVTIMSSPESGNPRQPNRSAHQQGDATHPTPSQETQDRTARPGAGPTAGTSSHSGGSGERTLTQGVLYYTAIVWAHKWKVILVTAFAGVAAVFFSIVSLILPPEVSPYPNIYRATAELLIQGDGQTSVTQGMLAALGLDVPGGGGSTNTAQLAIAVLNSRTFVDQIVEEFDIVERYEIEENEKSRSREIVLGNSQFATNRDTGTLSISYEDIYPEVAQDIANAMVANLQEWFISRGGATQSSNIRSLEAKLLEVEGEVARLEERIREFQAEYGALEPSDLAESQSALITDLQSQLVQLDVQIRNRRELLRVENDPEVARLESERSNLLQVISEIEEGYTGGARRLPPRSELPELSLEFRNLSADLEIQRRLHTALSEQYEVAKLNAEFEPGFSVLEYAEVPDEKMRPSRSMLTIQVTVGAAAAAVFLILLLHFVRQASKDPENKKVWQTQIAKAKAGKKHGEQ